MTVQEIIDRYGAVVCEAGSLSARVVNARPCHPEKLPTSLLNNHMLKPEAESSSPASSDSEPVAAGDESWPSEPHWTREGYKFWGERRGGALHGIGKVVSPSGAIFYGEFRHGEHIQGTAHYPNGVVEKGSFAQGWLLKGERVSPEGLIERGSFSNGVLIDGMERALNGAERVGTFRPPERQGRSGRGGQSIASGGSSSGRSAAGCAAPAWFQGRVTFPGGEVLDGLFPDGLLHGPGSIVSSNGFRWEGLFVEGVPVGRGKVTWPDGRTKSNVCCFPRWIGALSSTSSFETVVPGQLEVLQREIEMDDAQIPLAIWFSVALTEQREEILIDLLEVALRGWARTAFTKLIRESRVGRSSRALVWFLSLLGDKDREHRLFVIRTFVKGLERCAESLDTASVPSPSCVAEYPAILPLLFFWEGEDATKEENLASLGELYDLRDEPLALFAVALFKAEAIRWSELDPSHAADRQLMWRWLTYSQEPTPEATAWAASLTQELVQEDLMERFVPGWLFDQWIFDDVLPVPVREVLINKSPYHLLTLARLQGFLLASSAAPDEAEHQLLAEPFAQLAVEQSEGIWLPHPTLAANFLNSLLAALTSWSAGSGVCPHLFEVGGRLAAAALFYTVADSRIDWTLLAGWKAGDRGRFLAAFTDQVQGFHGSGARARSGLSSANAHFFLIVNLCAAHDLVEQPDWLQVLRSLTVELAHAEPESLADYRLEGVLIAPLRFLWASGVRPTDAEADFLVQHPKALPAKELRRVLGRWKTGLWDRLWRELSPETCLGSLLEWSNSGALPEWNRGLMDMVQTTCLRQPALLDPFRVGGILPAPLRWLWSEGLALTSEETVACVMNPRRYPGMNWRHVVESWTPSMWNQLLQSCGPVAVLRFLVEQLDGLPLKRHQGIAESIAQACLRAPAALLPYRVAGVLIPSLRSLWLAGLPMTRAEAFALIDDREIRREIVLWPSCVKRWPESIWGALLMERGLPAILTLLNEREPKEWAHLAFAARRGLIAKGRQLISPGADSKELAKAPEAAAPASPSATRPAAESVKVEFRLTRTCIQQIRRLHGLHADAVRLWLSNAAVGWYAQERPTTIEKNGRKWMHAHVVVPGGGICVIGYWRDRLGSKCTVGWLMESHNYAQLLAHALPEEDQIADTLALEEVRLSPEQEPQDAASSSSPSGAGPTSVASASGQPDERACLLAALRGNRLPDFGSSSEGDQQALERLRHWVGLESAEDLPFIDSLGQLETWLEPIVEEFYELVGAPAKDLNRAQGPRGYAISRFQKILARSQHAISRFFPGRQHEIERWSEVRELLLQIRSILQAWPATAWPENVIPSLANWMKQAASLDKALHQAELPATDWPLQLEALRQLVEACPKVRS